MNRDDVEKPPAAGEQGPPRQLPKSSSSASLSVTEGKELIWTVEAVEGGFRYLFGNGVTFVPSRRLDEKRMMDAIWSAHNSTLSVTEAHPTWLCGCGATNGVNLANCGVCTRPRGESEMPTEAHPKEEKKCRYCEGLLKLVLRCSRCSWTPAPSEEKEASSEPVKAVLQNALEAVIADLADPYKWNWTRQGWDERSAADKALGLLEQHGLVIYRSHPLGGHVWEINGHLYGRTDDVEPTGAPLPVLSSQPNEEQSTPPVNQTPSMEGANKQ